MHTHSHIHTHTLAHTHTHTHTHTHSHIHTHTHTHSHSDKRQEFISKKYLQRKFIEHSIGKDALLQELYDAVECRDIKQLLQVCPIPRSRSIFSLCRLIPSSKCMAMKQSLRHSSHRVSVQNMADYIILLPAQVYAEGVDMCAPLPSFAGGLTALHLAIELEDLTSLHIVDFILGNR